MMFDLEMMTKAAAARCSTSSVVCDEVLKIQTVALADGKHCVCAWRLCTHSRWHLIDERLCEFGEKPPLDALPTIWCDVARTEQPEDVVPYWALPPAGGRAPIRSVKSERRQIIDEDGTVRSLMSFPVADWLNEMFAREAVSLAESRFCAADIARTDASTMNTVAAPATCVAVGLMLRAHELLAEGAFCVDWSLPPDEWQKKITTRVRSAKSVDIVKWRGQNLPPPRPVDCDACAEATDEAQARRRHLTDLADAIRNGCCQSIYDEWNKRVRRAENAVRDEFNDKLRRYNNSAGLREWFEYEMGKLRAKLGNVSWCSGCAEFYSVFGEPYSRAGPGSAETVRNEAIGTLVDNINKVAPWPVKCAACQNAENQWNADYEKHSDAENAALATSVPACPCELRFVSGAHGDFPVWLPPAGENGSRTKAASKSACDDYRKYPSPDLKSISELGDPEGSETRRVIDRLRWNIQLRMVLGDSLSVALATCQAAEDTMLGGGRDFFGISMNAYSELCEMFPEWAEACRVGVEHHEAKAAERLWYLAELEPADALAVHAAAQVENEAKMEQWYAELEAAV